MKLCILNKRPPVQQKPTLQLFLEYNEKGGVELHGMPTEGEESRIFLTIRQDGTLYLNQNTRYQDLPNLPTDKKGRLLIPDIEHILHTQQIALRVFRIGKTDEDC